MLKLKKAAGQASEGIAGGEFRQLLVIADEYQLALRLFDSTDQPGELTRGKHARLVDHEDDETA